jgi:SP family sugar:H+ symporter-like MFS transporter
VLFFSTVGINNPFFVQAGIFIVGIPPTFASQYLIERFGRRPILLTTGACMAISSLIMGSLGLLENKTYALKQAVAATVYIFIIFFSAGWGPTVWVVCSELCTGRNRNKLMSLSTGTNWLFTWVVSFTFPYLYDPDAANLGPKIGFVYGSLMAAACVWVFFFLPETAQRTLEEIDEMFAKGVPAREFSSKSNCPVLLFPSDVRNAPLLIRRSYTAYVCERPTAQNTAKDGSQLQLERISVEKKC